MARKIFAIMLAALTALTALSCAKQILPDTDKERSKKIKQLYRSPNWQERRKAIREISKLRKAVPVELLLQALDDIHPSVRIEALKVMYKFLPDATLEKIRASAQFEKNGNVRWYALKVLSRYRDPGSAPIFAAGLQDRDWLIREESVKGLIMIDDYLTKYVCIPLFIKALQDERVNVRIATLEYLDIKDIRLYTTIAGMLRKNPENNNTTLSAILKALKGYQIDEGTRKVLLKLLIHPNREIRILAFRALNESKEKGVSKE